MSLQHALHALALGFATVPPLENGTKAPCAEWKTFQTRLPTSAEVNSMYASGLNGLGIVMGEVSGNLEMFDFDSMDAYTAFVRRARACGLGDLVARIEAGYLEASPKPGRHWLWRTDPVGKCTKLAMRPATDEELADNPDDPYRTLIETKGTGGYGIVAPTNGKVHPNGGRYELLAGGLDRIATITPLERADLCDLARSFDVKGHQRAVSSPVAPSAGRPGDRWAEATEWPQIMVGWHVVARAQDVWYLRRPGKDRGISATVNFGGSDLLYVFTSSTEFEANTSYTKFGAYAVLEHGGDHRAAAQDLARQGWIDHEQPRSRPVVVVDEDGWVTSAELAVMEIPETRWLVRGLIPTGLVQLVGIPKVGKSFMALNVALGITQGTNVMGVPCEAGDVLYLALEDTKTNFRDRSSMMLGGKADPTNLHIYPSDAPKPFPRIDEGAVESLEARLQRLANPRLVVIDTFVKISPADEKKSAYRYENEAWSRLKRLADTHGICVMVLHHENTSQHENRILAVSGTNATAGAADAIMSLRRRGDAASLWISGRNVEEQEHAVRFDKDLLTWRILGTVEQYRHESLALKIAELVVGTEPYGPKEIADELNEDYRAVANEMARMARKGELRRVGRGKYLGALSGVE